MRTYTSIADTPLRFHKFIWYVWQPFSLLIAIYNAWEAIAGFLEYPLLSANFSAVILFAILSLAELAFVLAPILIFVGFFKWKAYAWYILMFLSVSNAVSQPLLILGNLSTEDVPSLLGRVMGVAIDVIIALYYWKRRALFNIHLLQEKEQEIKMPEATEDPYYFCHNCGNKLPLNSLFCNQCGTKIPERGR